MKIYASFQIAGLDGLRIPARGEERAVVVLLHGYAMQPQDLAPLAEAMGLPATLYLPRGTEAAVPQGRAWWAVDSERRATQIAQGARDLFDEQPPRRDRLRTQFAQLAMHLAAQHDGRPLILVGFSQGGMLAADLVLHGSLQPRALALLSSSCIAATEWQARGDAARELPVLIAHGQHDEDLSIHAGERLRDLFGGAGAQVTWLPFDGGHGIPLIVWRELRRFATQALNLQVPPTLAGSAA